MAGRTNMAEAEESGVKAKAAKRCFAMKSRVAGWQP
jgi:hypothetical protein